MVFEAHYGSSLDWFFQPWVYGENRPDYRWSWVAGDQGPPYGVMVHVEQVQSNAGLFTMPIDIKIHTTAGDVLVVAWNDQLSQDFFFDVDAAVTDVSFDPGNWILKYVTEISTGAQEDVAPGALSLSAPAGVIGGDVRLVFSVPTTGHVELAVFDIAGRRVTTLADGVAPSGTHEVVWNGSGSDGAPVASGVYFARLVADSSTASQKLLLVR